ncbi:TPA: ProQ/FINO family protein [Klebsiella michiganensis]
MWPEFDKGNLRPMKVGIKEQVKAYIEANPDCGMTFSQWIQAVIRIVRGLRYQRCVREGETRYDIYGEPAGVVTAKEAAYARLQVKRIKARLDARETQNHVTAE